MREGSIKYQFPLKKDMEHFPRKRKKLLFDSILRANFFIGKNQVTFQHTIFLLLRALCVFLGASVVLVFSSV
jgi:hypothetical protein